MSFARKIVMMAAVALFGIWMWINWGQIAGDSDALIRFTLGILFAALIIMRRKIAVDKEFLLPGWSVAVSFGAGILGIVVGLIFRNHIVEWSGVLLMLFACALWAAPRIYARDLIIAFIILFWMHPIPGSIFGWLAGNMQRLSVAGAEIVLHTFNVRVWGDSAANVLRTGYQDFMVPESCSGMRTSVTVLLCTMGVGTLLRLRWYEIIGFVLLGLLQVLVLNIVRISYMVIYAPRMSPEWAENFLHDSLSIFLLGSILLVQLEAAWYRAWSVRRNAIRQGIKDRVIEAPDKASIIPHPLRRLIFVMAILAVVGVIGVGIFGVAFKMRPQHRKEMIREVAEGLMESNPDAADRAIKEALNLVPGNSELLNMQARTDFVRGRFEDGLAIYQAKEDAGEVLGLAELVLKGWALMRQDRISDARKVIDGLPPAVDSRPGVAMLKAEFGALDNQPESVAHYVVLAAKSSALLPRIRRLFAYLAVHEQWQAIADADLDYPYDAVYQAMIAIYAYQQIGDLGGVSRVMTQVIKKWPDDIRFLTDLYRLALQRQGSDWETSFEHNLLANLRAMKADGLAMTMDFCWRLSRPDLAWIVFSRLKSVDASDPALLVAPAKYGPQWCLFRKHQLNIGAESSGELLDLAPVISLFQECRPFDGLIERIPILHQAMAASDRKVRDKYLEECLAELKRREAAAPLNERLLRMYPAVLVMAQRYDEAHKRLDDMLVNHPDWAARVQFQHAMFYDQQGKWEKAYEALKKYSKLRKSPNLRADLVMVKSCMNLNMGLQAMDVTKRARDVFPGSFRLDLAESAVWDVFGFKEQALYVISRTPGGKTSPVCVALLYSTGRLNAARNLSEATGVPLPVYPIRQLLKLPDAGFSMQRHWPAPLTQEARKKRIAGIEKAVQDSISPYFKALRTQELAWHRARALANEVPASVTDQWKSIGRDADEKVGALYALAMLAAEDRFYEVADRALQEAVRLQPDSRILWRVRISLSEGSPEIVDEAYRNCPQDSEIMLSKLVLETHRHGGGLSAGSSTNRVAGDWGWATNMVSDIVAAGSFSPGTLVRAGDYLLSRGQTELAARLARAAIVDCRGLLAAYVLGLQVALRQQDLKWANECAISGIENAQDPTPFYKILVDIKAYGRKVDSYLIEALEYLQDQKGAGPQWSEMLGKIYFQKGDVQRSLSIFSSVIRGDTRNVSMGTLILAAEAARRNAKMKKAVSILESAYEAMPDRVPVLNNLVYLLAQDPSTLARARALMPKLVELGGDSFAVMDTIAMVYMRSGDMDNARLWMNKAMKSLKANSYSAQEVRLNAAEIEMRSGNYKKAREAIDQLRHNNDRTDFIDQKARGLMREINALKEGIE